MRFVPGGVRQVWSREGREKEDGNEEVEEEDEGAVRMFQTAKETGISSSVSFRTLSLFSVLLLDGTVMTFKNVLLPSNSFHPWTIWACRQFQMSVLWDWRFGIR